MEKKSMLLKSEFLTKKCVSSDNLSTCDAKQWSSTVRKPLTTSRLNVNNIIDDELVMSTPFGLRTPRQHLNIAGSSTCYK